MSFADKVSAAAKTTIRSLIIEEGVELMEGGIDYFLESVGLAEGPFPSNIAKALPECRVFRAGENSARTTLTLQRLSHPLTFDRRGGRLEIDLFTRIVLPAIPAGMEDYLDLRNSMMSAGRWSFSLTERGQLLSLTAALPIASPPDAIRRVVLEMANDLRELMDLAGM